MASSDLSELIAAKSEALEVEYKAWMDTADGEVKAKLAKHLAALHNHGGGFLIFGVDDKTRVPQGPTTLSRTTFSEDAISSIVKRYLEPAFQCQVTWASLSGTDYPVVIVPGHGGRPTITKSDGPRGTDGKPVGVAQGVLYIRVPGPASEAIRKADDWFNLLDRCLQHRADKLASIMRQALAQPVHVSSRVADYLKAACDTTAEDFVLQVRSMSREVDASDRDRVAAAADKHVVLGYALIGTDGELIPIDQPRTLNERTNIGMHQYAYHGWSHFLPLTHDDRAPQLQSALLLGKEVSYLEGMRAQNAFVLAGELDYWRIYDIGIACTVSSYREDYNVARGAITMNYISVLQALIKLHSILAHARLVGQELPEIGQVMIRMDWKGLKGRALILDEEGTISAATPTGDRFTKTLTLPWAKVRDDYLEALRHLAIPFFEMFNLQGDYQPNKLLTRELIQQEFARVGSTMRLFES